MAVAETTPLHDSEGQDSSDEKRVSPLELFFDLVFVFALTQVTALMADNPTWDRAWRGDAHSSAMLWWAWASYSWLTNFIAAERGGGAAVDVRRDGRLPGRRAGGAPPRSSNDALVFALAYAAVRWLHIFIFAEANDGCGRGHGHPATRAHGYSPGPALLIAAAFLDPPYQALVWILGAGRSTSWAPTCSECAAFCISAGHFAERFCLIIIIALGESIVAIGAGVEGDLDAGVDRGGRARLVGRVRRWWAYFDVVGGHGRATLSGAPGP